MKLNLKKKALKSLHNNQVDLALTHEVAGARKTRVAPQHNSWQICPTHPAVCTSTCTI
ncbi:hypothetical protein [Pseudoalteromonas luteoviolacea]|uniref:Uncharacterized protein n=1 Tax=Pseudoalteromonas luteoviolacea H33 TaxID=1365251 RepID=A0A167F391_9GAMM|nr:hypothetical protein [Pseudoalteromonas luteoviolacea]KZN51581.1 hypothetical protein N476_12195 [Pseudoalteromonas luteoviolacea H33]KZN79162.1 hypothetical protein N477_06575 [Pseudoalteromonas luteoviolacea H33-S]MBQ4878146.1 hypothetical protein [Pseudoalteromonas luteoviolacea]MBQ4907301.1 hypothetical protein [Pseudoalteromonas luteoviolacea]